MATATHKYRTLKTVTVEGQPDLAGRQKRLNELAVDGWKIATTVTYEGAFIDTLVMVTIAE